MIIDGGTKVYDGTLAGIREQYGTSRQLDVEFAGRVEIAPIEKVDITSLNENKKRFVFESREVHINELMNHILSHYPVRDINISEPEIENIIRKIYNREVAGI